MGIPWWYHKVNVDMLSSYLRFLNAVKHTWPMLTNVWQANFTARETDTLAVPQGTGGQGDLRVSTENFQEGKRRRAIWRRGSCTVQKPMGQNQTEKSTHELLQPNTAEQHLLAYAVDWCCSPPGVGKEAPDQKLEDTKGEGGTMEQVWSSRRKTETPA